MPQSKQPTATAFVRKQESWVQFVLEKVRANIEEREEALRENGWPEESLYDDEKLRDLYDDELFYERYGEELVKQREFIRKKYFGDD